MLNKTKISAILLSLSLTLGNAHAAETAFENQAVQILSESLASAQQQLSAEITQELNDNLEQALSYDIQDTLTALANQTRNSENKKTDSKQSIASLEFHDEQTKKQTGE
jgi:hypothetical protein